MLRQPVRAQALPQRPARAAQVEPRCTGAPRRAGALRTCVPARPSEAARAHRCVVMSASSTPGNASSADAKSQQIVPRMTPEQLEALDKKVKGGDNFVQAVAAIATKGGLIVRFGESGSGFVPASQLDLSRLPVTVQAEAASRTDSKWLTEFVGKKMDLVVIEVNQQEGKVFLSEKAAAARKAMSDLKVGDVRRGEVSRVAEYGAFVRLERADGAGPLLGVEGLVHVSEIQWSRLRYATDALKPGQAVTVKVIKLDTENRQVGLSIKQLQPDPIMETLDTVLPLDGSDAGEAQGPHSNLPLPGLQELVEQMRTVPGVKGVTLGRQATEQRVVSQDLELWMTNQAVEGGFSVVARMGKRVQELRVQTDLGKEEVKAMLRTISIGKK